MALNEEGGIPATMLVGPQGNGMGGFGGDWGWIILLLLLGWGNNGFGGGYGGGDLYPWMNQANLTSGGFRDALVNDNLTQIQTGLNALQAQFAQCCCDNRLGVADLKYTVATENCADRTQSMQNTRDIIDSQTRSTQAVLDKLCQLELDGYKARLDAKNERIAELQTQLNMSNLAASQGAQTARILADNAAQTAALEQYLAPTPRPAYVVQNPNCCQSGCGLNCGVGIA